MNRRWNLSVWEGVLVVLSASLSLIGAASPARSPRAWDSLSRLLLKTKQASDVLHE